MSADRTMDTGMDAEESIFPRIALGALDGDAVVLCATARLAQELRRQHDDLHAARGLSRWPSLKAATVEQWLDGCLDAALLAGGIAADDAPLLRLGSLQEALLWERAIEAGSEGEEKGADVAALFDRAGMAAAAAEAHALMVVWGIRPDGGPQSEETRNFLRWRAHFLRFCAAQRCLDAARFRDWQIDRLAAGVARLPQTIALAGFDRYNPQELRLARAFGVRGVAVFELEQGLPAQAAVLHAELPDRLAECRAAVAWAAQRLAEEPRLRLGIVVPELGELRDTLEALLDDALDPAALNPAHAEMPRDYNFTLGRPLDRQPLVAVALQLLSLCARSHRFEAGECSALLRQPFWSADIAEADDRARLDARLREAAHLSTGLSLDQWLRFARREAAQLGIPALLANLETLRSALTAAPKRQDHAAWATTLRGLLAAAGWPGERALSSHEFQARRAFEGELDALGELDVVQRRVTLGEAVRNLARSCRARIFQPKTEGDPPVQVMGLLEAAGTPLDALWAMGMNDHLWPPPPRPNPLLPAELQRRVCAPNASAETQADFAAVIHRRLLRSAPQAILSWAHGEGDRELRPSPLLGELARAARFDAATLAAPDFAAAQAGSAALERIDDRRGPSLAPGEMLRGGTALLRAQALCPAWAFHRYRLGASALQRIGQPFDEAARGRLVHLVLQCFWRGRSSAELQAMTPADRVDAIAQAVDAALAEFAAGRDLPLSPRMEALERERLRRLAALWLDCEAGRGTAFRVIACEEAMEVDIEGIRVRLRIDRVDELDDGRRMVLDYKTGREVSQASWAEARIREPQLPVYAAFALSGDADALAAVAFARVRADGCGFIGIAAGDGLLPKVAGIDSDAGRKRFPEAADWTALLAHWRGSLVAIVREILDGEAAVSFADERDLEYCEVRPLLRLAERRTQIEAEAKVDCEPAQGDRGFPLVRG